MHASSGNLKNLKPHRPLPPKTPARKTKHPHIRHSYHYSIGAGGGGGSGGGDGVRINYKLKKMGIMKKAVVILFSFLCSSGYAQNITSDSLKLLFAKIDSLEAKLDSTAPKIIVASIGGNLDFLEKVKVNGIYFDIDFFLPKLINKSGNKFLENFGLAGRVNQGRIISKPDTIGDITRPYFQDVTNDSITKISVTYRSTNITSASYLSGQLVPTYRIAGSNEKPKGNKSNSALYLAYNCEFFRYESSYKYNQEIITSDTLRMQISNPSDTNNIIPFTPRSFSNKSLAYSFNNGIGFIYQYNSKFVSLNVKTIFGIGHVGATDYSKRGLFYNCRVEAIENVLGFKVGFEIRGVDIKAESIKDQSPIPTPNVSFYFAKTFNLSNLKTLVMGG